MSVPVLDSTSTQTSEIITGDGDDFDFGEDEIKVAWFNSGYTHFKSFYWLELGSPNASAWTHYAKGDEHYRFVGFQLFVSSNRVTTERMTYGLGRMLGEVGGLFKMLDFFFGLGFSLIAPARLFPYLA